MQKFEFNVGDRYENRKGIYEVIAISGENMIIQWDTGETVETDIAGQARVLRNMKRELEGPKRSAKKKPDWYGLSFEGLVEQDFKEDVTGTTWRSRNSLGGLIAGNMASGNSRINSWAIYGSPIIHIADMDKYARCEARYQAKFIVRTYHNLFWAGLMIERSNVDGEPRNDWNAFLAWLEDNEQQLHNVALRNRLKVSDPYRTRNGSLKGIITPGDKGWLHQRDEGSNPDYLESLSGVLTSANSESWIDMYIAKTWTMEEAMARGRAIGIDCAKLFDEMFILYAAATGLKRS